MFLPGTLTEEELDMIGKIRDRGIAICFFEVHELRGASSDDVEDYMDRGGQEAIDEFGREDEE